MIRRDQNKIMKAVDENTLACERILKRELTPTENMSILKLVLFIEEEKTKINLD